MSSKNLNANKDLNMLYGDKDMLPFVVTKRLDVGDEGAASFRAMHRYEDDGSIDKVWYHRLLAAKKRRELIPVVDNFVYNSATEPVQRPFL